MLATVHIAHHAARPQRANQRHTNVSRAIPGCLERCSTVIEFPWSVRMPVGDDLLTLVEFGNAVDCVRRHDPFIVIGNQYQSRRRQVGGRRGFKILIQPAEHFIANNDAVLDTVKRIVTRHGSRYIHCAEHIGNRRRAAVPCFFAHTFQDRESVSLFHLLME